LCLEKPLLRKKTLGHLAGGFFLSFYEGKNFSPQWTLFATFLRPTIRNFALRSIVLECTPVKQNNPDAARQIFREAERAQAK
jgi:hypothetical protein